MGRSLCAWREVAFDQIVLTSGCGAIGNDVEASAKKPERLCHQIPPVD
ncbi:hypothetical protein [Nostoc sp. 'Peltigera malacea cyanobiont' DB3992]|nr:hypothetical protein [Nostoc sp. 'Peltigera malacea cyanobiont' DB3992]